MPERVDADLITITIRSLLPELRDKVKPETTMDELHRLFRALPFGGVYAHVDGHCTGIHRHGPRLFVSKEPGPWRDPANAVLVGEAFWRAAAQAFGMEVERLPTPAPKQAPVQPMPAVQGTLF